MACLSSESSKGTLRNAALDGCDLGIGEENLGRCRRRDAQSAYSLTDHADECAAPLPYDSRYVWLLAAGLIVTRRRLDLFIFPFLFEGMTPNRWGYIFYLANLIGRLRLNIPFFRSDVIFSKKLRIHQQNHGRGEES